MKNLKNIVVGSPRQISVKWAQYILNQHAVNAKVSNVVIHDVNIGTTTRLQVGVQHDAPDILPSRWFVKIPSLSMKSRFFTALPRLLHKEVSFYKSLAETTPVKLPRVLAAQSRFGVGSTLVMTDLKALGFRPGQPSDALSVIQAGQVVEHLAQLHGHYWENNRLLTTHRWLGGFSSNAENQLGSLLSTPLMKRGLALAGDLIPHGLHPAALRYAANRRKIIKTLASGPQTLVHHDCHPGNLFWTDSGPGFFDWQLVRMGEGIGDVAYFLATALDPEHRRAHEKQLLELYAAALHKCGVPGLDTQTLYNRYRAHLSYPFEAMVVTLAIGGMMELNSNMALIERATAAVADNDSFAALEA